MKKTIGLFILIVFSFILVSCGEKKVHKTDKNDNGSAKIEHTVALEEMIEQVCYCLDMDAENLGDEYNSVFDDRGNEIKRTYKTQISDFSFKYGNKKNSLKITLDDLVCKCEFDQRGLLLSMTATKSNKKTKEMEVTYYDSGMRQKSILRGKESEIVTLFDESGKEYEEIEYDDQGEMVTKIETDNNGIKTETHFDSDDYTVREYDIDGNCIKYSVFGNDDVIQRWYIYEYDEEGKEIKYSEYEADGSLSEWTEYKYKGDTLDESTTYNAEGGVMDIHYYPTELFEQVETGLSQLFSSLDDISGAEAFFWAISKTFGE